MKKTELKRHLSQCEYQLKTALIAVENARNQLDKMDELPITSGKTNAPIRTKAGHKLKIENDPELEAFLLERVSSYSLEAMRDEVANTFPKARQVSVPTIARWKKRIDKDNLITLGNSQ